MIRVGCAYRAGLIPWLWQHGDLIDVFEQSLDGLISGGEDGLAAAETCAEMRDFTLHSIGLSLGSPAARSRPQQIAEARDVIRVMGLQR